jgi:hypothetical protein
MYRLEKSRRLGSFLIRYGRLKSYDTIRMVHGKIPSLLYDVHALGQQSRYAEILHRIDSVPLNVIIEAAVEDLKTQNQKTGKPVKIKNVSYKVDNFPTAFSYIFDACVRRQSSKMQRLIECIAEHPNLANSVGAKSLFDACVVLHDYQSKSRNSMKSTLLSKLQSVKDENLEIFCKEDPIGSLFLSHYTDWFLGMDSRQRIHQTVDLMAHKHPNFDANRYWNAMIQYLHYLGNTAPEGESSVYYTAVGDVTMSGYTAARMSMKVILARERITNKFLRRDSISNGAFSLAVTSLVSSSKFPDWSSDKWRKFVSALLTTCPDNSFASIHLRGIFLQVLISGIEYMITFSCFFLIYIPHSLFFFLSFDDFVTTFSHSFFFSFFLFPGHALKESGRLSHRIFSEVQK